MERRTMKVRNEFKAGLFIVVSTALIASLILVMGKEHQIFARQSSFYAHFSDVKGLASGAPVRLGGIAIGRVDEVGFSHDAEDSEVHVTLLINNSFLDRVKTDSVATIDTQGLLGDRFISLSSGNSQARLAPGGTIQSATVADLDRVLIRAQQAVENTAQITEQINAALIGLSPDTFKNIASASQSIARISDAVRSEKGFIHRLIYSEKEGAELIRSLATTSSDVSNLIREVQTGTGILHALFYSETGTTTANQILTTLRDISAASKGFSAMAGTAETQHGVLHDLLYTPVEPGAVARRIEEVLSSLAAVATNLQTTSNALAYGSGSLGAFIIDPTLYDNLIEVTDGAKRSFILRQAIRSSLKK